MKLIVLLAVAVCYFHLRYVNGNGKSHDEIIILKLYHSLLFHFVEPYSYPHYHYSTLSVFLLILCRSR